MTIHALLFDVDGTLADTEEAHRRSFNAAFGTCGLDWQWSPAEYRALLRVTGGKERIAAHVDTLDLPASHQRILRERIPEIHAEKTRCYGQIVADGSVPLRSGVARLIGEARESGCLLGIATTTTAANVEALLSATLGPDALDAFAVIVCGDAVRAKKPAPDIYELALRTLGLDAEQAVAFEDSENGLRAARAAGLYTVVTPTYWTEDGDLRGADLLLPELGDPDRPIAGEPGQHLRGGAWLTLAELAERRRPVPGPVAALYS